MSSSLHWWLPAFFLLLIGSAEAFAQQRAQQSDRPTPDIFRHIDRDFRSGKLTVDQKVLYKYLAKHQPQELPGDYQPERQSVLKCGTPATQDFYTNRNKLSESTVSEISRISQNPQIQFSETYRSPSGKFDIHYYTSGEHAVPSRDEDGNGIPDYVEQAASAADSSYRHQVQTLGYTDPIPAGETYNIEILNLENFYGEALSPSHFENPYNNTLIRVENDFAEGFPPNDDPEGDQIGALKVTIAHEFKHAIEFAANRWQGETGDWLEMDATMMEEVTYDNVNDYYNYIQTDESIFSNPTQSFYPGSYYHATWGLFFDQKYGDDFWPEVWEIIKDNPNITMVDALSQQLGSQEAFREAYVESQLWHFASGAAYAADDYGFEESTAYPQPPVEVAEELYSKNFSIPRPSPRPGVQGFAARYYEIPSPDATEGSLVLELTSNSGERGVGIIFYYSDGTAQSTATLLARNESTFTTENLEWGEVEKIGLVLTNSNTSTSDGLDSETIVSVGSNSFESASLSQNYPNPFNPQTRIRFTLEQSQQVELKVFNSAGQLVTTIINEELSAGLHEPVFDGSGLSSGIYFYQLIAGDQVQIKKMTLIK